MPLICSDSSTCTWVTNWQINIQWRCCPQKGVYLMSCGIKLITLGPAVQVFVGLSQLLLGEPRINFNPVSGHTKQKLGELWDYAIVSCKVEPCQWFCVFLNYCLCFSRTLITGMASGSIVAFNIDFNRWHYEHQNRYWRQVKNQQPS